MQIPSLPGYMTVPQQPSYNAVKIDVHNPMVNAPANQPYASTQYPTQSALQPQYAMPTMPIYNYPQAPYQPYYMPQFAVAPEVVTQNTQQAVPVQQPQVQAQTIQPISNLQAVPAIEIPMQPAVVPPAPVITEAPKVNETKQSQVAEDVNNASQGSKNLEVVEPQEIKPLVDINGFIAKLSNPDFEVQASAMEEIANMIDKEPQKALDLLDQKIIDQLKNIINNDTSALAGPTPEQDALRQKLFNNEQVSDSDKTLALSMTPKEQAERNKSYAIFTTAIMQKLYAEEYKMMNNASVPLTELPGAVTIVEQLKNNPNSMVRTSAIEALSYIQEPNYKKDLNTVFTIAQNDMDKGVQEAAKIALQKLNEIPDAEQPA